MKFHFFISVVFLLLSVCLKAQNKRTRDHGISIGVLPPGKLNAITDVEGVRVGHTTIIQGDSVRTGVTSVIAHSGNLYQFKVPAGVYVGNGFGKLSGTTQVQELGNLETPIILTNTLSVPTAMNAVINYTLKQKGNEKVRSVNAVVGETNDGGLNDIRGMHINQADVIGAILNARSGNVEEGNIGAGTGTIAFGFKGGIGTASRKIPARLGGYTVGVLVQTNFGGVLQINGVPVGEEMNRFYLSDEINTPTDGSCMIIVATDAPLDNRNLQRLAKRAFMGLAKTGGIAHNGSGDYVIAFSTDSSLRVLHESEFSKQNVALLTNDAVSPLFLAVIEATEEAIINSLFAAKTTMANGKTIKAIPVEQVIEIMKKYNRIK